MNTRYKILLYKMSIQWLTTWCHIIHNVVTTFSSHQSNDKEGNNCEDSNGHTQSYVKGDVSLRHGSRSCKANKRKSIINYYSFIMCVFAFLVTFASGFTPLARTVYFAFNLLATTVHTLFLFYFLNLYWKYIVPNVSSRIMCQVWDTCRFFIEKHFVWNHVFWYGLA